MAWDSIRGHDAARDRLLGAHARGRLAHAYLFVGPDGVGKRLFASELTKALLCEAPPGPLRACDRCPACQQVLAGTHPDGFAARRDPDENELSVDVMRAFTHRLGLKPSRGSRKVGLVEEADEFNQASANAFLKPLEEPPPGSLLILLASTTERQLPTILSRCQVVTFAPLAAADVRAVLADHGVLDAGRADRLVRLSGGSPGRALALNTDDLWGFRETLLAAVTAPRFDAAALAEKWGRFVEDAGKAAPLQRERAALVLTLLVGMVRDALGGGGDPAEAGRLAALGGRAGPETLADWLEACVAADTQIGRYLPVGLVIEALVDRLARRPVS